MRFPKSFHFVPNRILAFALCLACCNRQPLEFTSVACEKKAAISLHQALCLSVSHFLFAAASLFTYSDPFLFGLFLSCSLRSFVPRRGRVAFVATWPRNRFAVLSRTRLSKPSFSDSWRQSPSLKVCCWSTIRSCCENGGQFLMPCKFRGNMSWSASSRLHRFAAPLPCSFPGTPCGCIPFFGGSFFILGHSTPAASSGCTPRCAGKKPLSASACFEYRRVLIRFDLAPLGAGHSWRSRAIA